MHSKPNIVKAGSFCLLGILCPPRILPGFIEKSIQGLSVE